MGKNGGTGEKNVVSFRSAKDQLEDEVDRLFRLPLADFTGARNTLAAQLKQGGRANDANLVKALAKPSVSAWAVNQLYWNHRDSFDRLLAAGQRLRQLQSSGLAGKVADMRASLDMRREALIQLSDLATSLLQEAGHSPSLDTIRRITTTLEAISSYASLSDGPMAGRLTQDVDPPGFESLASFVPTTPRTESRVSPSKKPDTPTARTRSQPAQAKAEKPQKLEVARQAMMAAAKVSLQSAKKSLADARARSQSLESAQKRASAEAKLADAEAKQAAKELREAEQRLKEASAASEDATQRAKSIAAEARDAVKAVDEAKRALDRASKELESLLRNSSK